MKAVKDFIAAKLRSVGIDTVYHFKQESEKKVELKANSAEFYGGRGKIARDKTIESSTTDTEAAINTKVKRLLNRSYTQKLKLLIPQQKAESKLEEFFGLLVTEVTSDNAISQIVEAIDETSSKSYLIKEISEDADKTKLIKIGRIGILEIHLSIEIESYITEKVETPTIEEFGVSGTVKE